MKNWRKSNGKCLTRGYVWKISKIIWNIFHFICFAEKVTKWFRENFEITQNSSINRIYTGRLKLHYCVVNWIYSTMKLTCIPLQLHNYNTYVYLHCFGSCVLLHATYSFNNPVFHLLQLLATFISCLQLARHHHWLHRNTSIELSEIHVDNAL